MIQILKSPYLKPVIGLVIFALLLNLYGCSYYKVVNTDIEKFQKTTRYRNSDEYRFFLHHSDGISELQNIRINNDTLIAFQVQGSPGRPIALYNENAPNKQIRASNRSIIDEVHIYLNPEISVRGEKFILLPPKYIQEIRIISSDSAKDLGTVLASAFVVTAIIGLILLATKSSCPYVYSYDSDGLNFEGEIYSGAVLQNLERTDYLKLSSIEAVDHTLKVRISNELHENQFINQADLIIVDHPRNTEVFIDQNGKIRTITNPIKPLNAISSTGKNLLPELVQIDTIRHFFNDSNSEQNQVILTFKKPKNIKEGKLVLRGKNSLWFDYIFGEFARKFGNKFDHWKKNQAKLSRETRIKRIRESQFPLTISVKNNQKWDIVDHLYMVGPLGEREMIVPLNLFDDKDDIIEIKLETGFMFWEIDYAAIDFSEDKNVKVETLTPIEVEAKNKKAQQHLAADDHLYLEQKKIGDHVDLTFPAISKTKDYRQTIFLHCKGYYEHIRNYPGKAQVAELDKFRTPGYFSEFSKQEYIKLNRGMTVSASSN